MKKILLLILCVFVLVGCSTHTTKLQIQGIETIDYEKLIQNLNSDVTFMMYIGRPDCGDCQAFYPVLEEYVESHEGVGLYYLNVKEWKDRVKNEDVSKEEKAFTDNIYEELDFDWTPTLKLVNKGETIDEYTYLSQEYYEIKDEDKQAQEKQKYIEEFKSWMTNIYE